MEVTFEARVKDSYSNHQTKNRNKSKNNDNNNHNTNNKSINAEVAPKLAVAMEAQLRQTCDNTAYDSRLQTLSLLIVLLIITNNQ